MKTYKRIFVIVLDSLGIGAEKDAALYGDEGADTLGHIAEKMGSLSIPNLVLWHTEDHNLSRRKALYTAEGREYYSGNLLVPDDGEIIAL